MDDDGNINTMTIEERTERYIARRTAELRGDRLPLLMDPCTERYIARRTAELRGEVADEPHSKKDPYIQRRLAQLCAGRR
jgi:hypothetical protein